MTHEEIQAELAAYALGALDPEERRAVEQHLATGCAACTRELAGWTDVVGALALSPPQSAVPDLKQSLLERARRSRRGRRVIALRRWVPASLAAVAVALLALGITREARFHADLAAQQQLVAALRGQLGDAQDHLQRLSAELSAREHDVAALRATLAAAQAAQAVVQAPDLQLVRLGKTAGAPPATAHALISTPNHRALFYAFDLPTLPPHKTYELWWITEKEGPVNAGVFVPDQKGLSRVETAVPADAGAIQAAAVTIEPAGGVPKPTGTMVLLGSLKASG